MNFVIWAVVWEVYGLYYCVVIRVRFRLVECESRLKVVGNFLCLVGWCE